MLGDPGVDSALVNAGFGRHGSDMANVFSTNRWAWQ